MSIYKSIITYLVIASFLYSSTLCAYSEIRCDKETLATSKAFNFQIAHNLSVIQKILQSDDIELWEGELLRELFSSCLGDTSQGLGIVFNRELKEIFIYSQSKIAHLYIGEKTDLKAENGIGDNIGGINVYFYPASRDLIDSIHGIKEKIVIEGLPALVPENVAEKIRMHIAGILAREGADNIEDLPAGSLKSYLENLLKLAETFGGQAGRERPAGKSITSADFAPVPDGLVTKRGVAACGWLWIDGVPGLEAYDDNEEESIRKEARNARKVRDFIVQKGRQSDWREIDEDIEPTAPLLDSGHYSLSAFYPKSFVVWDGTGNEDKDLNYIIETNISMLLYNLPKEKRDELIKNLYLYSPPHGVAVAILDQSRYWAENSRGDGFLGINRYLLEKYAEMQNACVTMATLHPDKAAEFLKKVKALEIYLQAYIYHELRHEAFILEKEILQEYPQFQNINVESIKSSDEIYQMIASLGPEEQKGFFIELEKRQNRIDAEIFVMLSERQRAKNSEYDIMHIVENLMDLKIISRDSSFTEMVLVLGLAAKNGIQYNELIQDHFDESILTKKLKSKYYKLFKDNGVDSDKKKELPDVDLISYMLYKIGLNSDFRIIKWRKREEYRIKAKECIIRLIDLFMSYRISRLFGKVNFIKLDVPLTAYYAARELGASWLERSDFSDAVLGKLGFKTYGIVNEIAGNANNFYDLVEEACKEKGGEYSGIPADMLRRVTHIKDILPRWRAIYIFYEYLNTFISSGQKRIVLRFYQMYANYMNGEDVQLSEEEMKQIDRLYKDKLIKQLNEVFGLEKDTLEKKYGLPHIDILEIINDAVDVLNNLSNLSTYELKKGLGFGTEEIEKAILLLKEIFDKDHKIGEKAGSESVDYKRLESPETRNAVRILLDIYKKEILGKRDFFREILSHYGYNTNIQRKRICELVKETPGWASCLWLAQQYRELFSGNAIQQILDLDSAMALLSRALQERGITNANVTGFISDAYAKFFEDILGYPRGALFQPDTHGLLAETETKKKRGTYQLITSIFSMHEISNLDDAFNIFMKANELLKRNGHFAITLPESREFDISEDALRKMGFQKIFSGVTWNTISNAGLDKEKDKYESKKFYILILQKIGSVRKQEMTVTDKMQLIPQKRIVPARRSSGPDSSLPSERYGDITVGLDKRVEIPVEQIRGAEVFVSPDGRIEAFMQNLADILLHGLERSGDDTYRDDNIELFSLYQEEIKRLRGEIGIDAITEHNLGIDIENALGFTEITLSVMETLENLVIALERINNEIKNQEAFVKVHKEEFEQLLKEITQLWSELQNLPVVRHERSRTKLGSTEQSDLEKVLKYQISDLNRENYDNVKKWKEILLNIKQREEERKRIIAEQRNNLEERKRLIQKYRAVTKWIQGEIDEITGIKIEDMLIEHIKLMEKIDLNLAEKLAGKSLKIKTLEDFEKQVAEFFSSGFGYADNEFFFGFSDTEFLSIVKAQWIEEAVGEDSIFAKNVRAEMERFLKFIKLFIEWKDLKDIIDWDTGIAKLLKGKKESEYLDILDRQLLYEPFMAGQQMRGDIFSFTPLLSKEVIRDFLRATEIGSSVIVSVPERMKITADFLNALENMGFGIKNIFEIHLEPNNSTNISPECVQFLKRTKKVIVIEKTGNGTDIDPNRLLLGWQKDEEEDVDTRIDTRWTVLGDIDPASFHVDSTELLSIKQIRKLYPEWASEFLGKGKWEGFLFTKQGIEEAVEEYRIQQEERLKAAEDAKRIAKEREARLIKRTEKPVVKITYDDTWPESVVRDLASILKLVIQDFDNPPDINSILNSRIILEHPQLRNIPRNKIAEKINELIQYRQYDLKIERGYKLLNMLIGSLLPHNVAVHNCYVETKVEVEKEKRKEKRLLDLVLALGKGENMLFSWYDFNLGIDDSPFGSDIEQFYEEIVAKQVEVRHFSSEEFMKVCPEIMRMPMKKLKIHYLSDPGGILRRFGENIICSGKDAYNDEKEAVRNLIRDPRNTNQINTLNKIVMIYGLASQINELLYSIFKNKDVEGYFLEEFSGIIQSLLDKFIVLKNMDELGEFCEILSHSLGELKKLFNGQMPKDKYGKFKKELCGKLQINKIPAGPSPIVYRPIKDNITKIEGEILSSSDRANLESGEDLFYSYFYGKGQNKRIKIDKYDPICSYINEAPCEIDAKDYYDALRYAKMVDFYNLSDGERKEINNLVERIFLSADERNLSESVENTIAYLKTCNIVNRFIYFTYTFNNKVQMHKLLKEYYKYYEVIKKRLLEIEPKLQAYSNEADEMNLISVLTEYCRIVQMLEKEHMQRDGVIELNLRLIKLGRIITDRMVNRRFFYQFSILGNRHYWDLIIDMIIGHKYLSQIIQCYIEFIIADFENEADSVNKFFNKMYIMNVYSSIIPSLFNEEILPILESIARAIVTLRKHRGPGIEENIKAFLSIVKKHMPEQYKKIREIIQSEAGEKQRDIDYKGLNDLAEKINKSELSLDEVAKINNYLIDEQTFRLSCLLALNKLCNSNSGDFKIIDLSMPRIRLAMKNILNPYEIYYLFKNIFDINKIGGNHRVRGISNVLMNAMVAKMEEFLNTEQKDMVTDILTRNYYQFAIMKYFVWKALEESNDFRKYITEMFLFSEPRIAQSAFGYIVFYLANEKVFREKDINIHSDTVRNIFTRLIEGILSRGDNLNIIRLREIILLFCIALEYMPGFTLEEQWKLIIGIYNTGQISDDALLTIKQLAELALENTCEEITDSAIRDDFIHRFAITDKDGKDIFEEAIRQKKKGGGGSTYFQEFTQGEANPQIKRIVSDKNGQFRILKKGIRNEGWYDENSDFDRDVLGGLTEADKYTDIINNVVDSLIKKYKKLRDLQDYDIWAVSGVSFSGHYGTKKRIYVPIEILEIAQECKNRNAKIKIKGTNMDLGDLILQDFIEHEYLHTKGWDEKDIAENSERKRPGVYEKARGLYREYVAQKLVELVGDTEGIDILKGKVDRILARVQKGKTVEFSETELRRILWLIAGSKDLNLTIEIAQLLDLIMEPNYTGNKGEVIMALEKELLGWLYDKKQFEQQIAVDKIGVRVKEEKQKILTVRRTIKGLWFSGFDRPNVEKAVRTIDSYKVPSPQPANLKQDYYVLIDEYRAEKYKDIIKEISKQWNVKFITEDELSEDINPDNIIVLVDPEDADREKCGRLQQKGLKWYLPLIYNKKSFILAAWLSAWLSINKPEKYEEIKNTLVFNFMMSIYKDLLGEGNVNEDEVVSWFQTPWQLRDKIKSISGDLKLLRIAMEQLDISA